MKIKKIALILQVGLLMGMTGCQNTGGRAIKPSEVTFEGVYKQEGVDNVEFLFAEDSTLQMNQHGIYELKQNKDGSTVVRLCFDDISRELPEDYNYMDYDVLEMGKRLKLTYITQDESIDVEPIELVLLKGKNGLLGKEYFNGTYGIAIGSNGFHYVFEKDGTVHMQVNQNYYADKTTMEIYDDLGSTDYLYQEQNGRFTLKNKQGDIIFELIKQEVE